MIGECSDEWEHSPLCVIPFPHSFQIENIHHRHPPLFKPPSLPLKPSLLHNSQTQDLLDICPSNNLYKHILACLSCLLNIHKVYKSSEYHEFDITWRASISIDGQNVIDALRIHRVMNYSQSRTPPYHSGIVDSCPEQQRDKLERLVGITLLCNSAKVSPVEEAWFQGLDDDVRNGLTRMFLGLGKHKMTIWFFAYPTFDVAIKNWGNELQNFVTGGHQSFWQYRTGKGEPKFKLEEAEPIMTFNKGMYVLYRGAKDFDGNLMREEDGIRVKEDMTKIKGFYNFERQLFWDVPFEFAVYNTIPVIRDVQFEQGQVAHIGGQPHFVHFQSLPKIMVKAVKGGYTLKELTGSLKGFIRLKTVGGITPRGTVIRGELDNSDKRIGKPHVFAKGHTVLVCAVSNNAIDKAANSCWENFPEDARRNFKFLRYETAAAEVKALVTRKDIKNPAQDPKARPEYKEDVAIEDDDLIENVMAEAAAQQGEHTKEIMLLFQQLGNYKAEIDSRKRSNVPAPMTLPNRCF